VGYIANGNGTATLTDDGSIWQLSGYYVAGQPVTNGGDIGSQVIAAPSASSSGPSSSTLGWIAAAFAAFFLFGRGRS
jgi:hypothetical protein